jgi:O-antigen/teichoic acid export membrane protein
MDNFITREENDFKNIFNRFKKRDFSGNTGIAIKNSTYQIGTVLVGKFLALLFTAILARVLMPELFGLYSLILATVFIFISFTDLGIDSAVIKFISYELGKKNKLNAKAYLNYLLGLKILLLITVSVIFILVSKYLAIDYYQKPIFTAFLIGPIIIVSTGLITFFESALRAANNFKPILFKEGFFQIARFVFVFSIFFLLIKPSFSKEITLFWVILGVSMAYILTLAFIFIFSRKTLSFKGVSLSKLSKKQKKQVIKFILPLSIVTLSAVIYAYVDIFILGRFVEASFIGFYTGAVSIIGSLAALVSFSVVMLPIFSRLRGKRLEQAFNKSLRIISIVSFAIFLGVFIFAPLIVNIILGKDYASSVIILRVLSLLMISNPLNAIYTSYFVSKGKTKFLARLFLSSTFINILLNLILITQFLKYGQLQAVIGASIATLVSKFLPLFIIIYKKIKDKK